MIEVHTAPSASDDARDETICCQDESTPSTQTFYTASTDHYPFHIMFLAFSFLLLSTQTKESNTTFSSFHTTPKIQRCSEAAHYGGPTSRNQQLDLN
jgi:hypothetical protein